MQVKKLRLGNMCSQKDLLCFARRTGRTGRMGNAGVNIVMYDPTAGEAGLLPTLERAAGIKFAPLEPPSSKDLIHTASKDAMSQIR
jgi:superfamily II DNA/RNA helicase